MRNNNNNKHIVPVIVNYTVLVLIGMVLLLCIIGLCISLVAKSDANHVYRGIIVGKEYVPNHKYYRCIGKFITTHEVDDQYVFTILGEEVDSDGLITDTEEELKTEKWCVSRDTYNKYNLDDEIDMLDIPGRSEFDDN